MQSGEERALSSPLCIKGEVPLKNGSIQEIGALKKSSYFRKIMSIITDIHARQILDSRGNPTVEVDVTLDSGTKGPWFRYLE